MHADNEQPFLRITQDQVLIQNEQTASTLQAVVCPVCLTILPLPYWICQGCDNTFCKTCIETWWQKQPNSCIFKCENAHFKMVKRSNTYQAIIDILRVRCEDCQQAISISGFRPHCSICPKKKVKCKWQNCSKLVARDELDEHLKICQFKTEKCQFCQLVLLQNILQNHQNNQCAQRPMTCPNQGCNKTITNKFYQDHCKECPFQKSQCQWCKQYFLINELAEHKQFCENRQFTCKWCQKKIFGKAIKLHQEQCSQKKICCPLCNQNIREIDEKEHRPECMFKQMIAFKKNQQILYEQNLKLKKRVFQLQDELQQSRKSQHEMTANSLMKIKQQQRKQYQRDLLRIRNSISSIRKCRNQQMSQHLKKLHLSRSLCPQCAIIRTKLENELQPLCKLQQQTLLKIKELQRIQSATRKSVIRL